MNNYVWNPNDYIWLSIPGGIQAWKPEELNKFIDKWNKQISGFVSNCDFFDYLSYEIGERFYGFAWNNKNQNFKTIRKAGGK